MPYSTNNPPALLVQGVQNAYPATWVHQSADTGAQVQVGGFITNGDALGMKVGDIVQHRNTATNITSRHVVVAVTANGAASLSDSTTDASGTNSD